MPDQSRQELVLAEIVTHLRRVIKAQVYPQLQECVSENDFDHHADQVIQAVITDIGGSYEFNRLISSGDTRLENGSLNAHGILKAIDMEADRVLDRSVQGMLRHLKENATLVFGAAKLLKKDQYEQIK